MISVKEPDFGGWLRNIMERSGISVQRMAQASTLNYAYLSRLLNSSKHGKPIRPEQGNIQSIIVGLQSLGVEVDAAVAFEEAGYRVEGNMSNPIETNSRTAISIDDIVRQLRFDLENLYRQTADIVPFDECLERAVATNEITQAEYDQIKEIRREAQRGQKPG